MADPARTERAAQITDSERREFKRNGFLVLHDVVPETEITAVRELIWETIDVDRDEPESWYDGGRSLGESRHLSDHGPLGDLQETVYAHADSLVGEGKLAPIGEKPTENCIHTDWRTGETGGPTLSYPNSDTEWNKDDLGPHLDGSAQGHGDGTVSYLPYTLGVTVYVDDVKPRGGGTVVWPGSHVDTGEYFADHDWSDYEDEGLPEEILAKTPFEVSGPAGTVFIWHPNLVHSAGPNVSDRIRMAVIGRYSRSDIADIGTDGLGDIWLQYEAFEDIEPRIGHP